VNWMSVNVTVMDW